MVSDQHNLVTSPAQRRFKTQVDLFTSAVRTEITRIEYTQLSIQQS